jgi:hypothetical protein
MKYLKLFENFSKSEIDEICKKYGITNYSINTDGYIDVNGNVNLSNYNLTELPLKFNKVTGNFSCYRNKLSTFNGSPNYIGGNFYCSFNYLTNLIDCPNYIGGGFDCAHNNLTSLEGYQEVGVNFVFIGNPIEDIIYLFGYDVKRYLDYQETYNFVRKDCKIVKHLFEEALKDYNEYYNRQVKLPEKIEGYTYI